MERWPSATAPFRLCAILLGLVLAGILCGPAAAEDFTGFYAGVNAGYGWGQESQDGVHGRAKPGAATSPPAWNRPQKADGLPPSAARAADRNPALSGRGGVR
ncbi:hypothetical protein [Methylobacterium sp. SyP6R]|uniref:hypothetical protein n=1 Tax=Methylobacterium sp. SyP6R TaxID=2718876 RepID=UPI001F3DE4F3|nr:hypothetical protein [Methylobacterium sp. SyP6R]MCF4125515.1 hypothetical protein [Methylobacterium sp. SyP6R]